MKSLNRNNVLYFVQDHGPVSQADITRELKMSKATVSTIVRELVEEGLLMEAGKADASVGRRPTLLELNPGSYSAVVADLSRPRPLIAVVSLAGEIVSRTTGPDLWSLKGQSALEEFLRFVESEVKSARKHFQRVCGVGIAVPGIATTPVGVVRSSSWLGWNDVPLGPLVSESTGLLTRVDNDVNLAAQGEMWKGAAKNARNLVMLQIGDGIGAAIVIDRQLYRGSNDAAGEVGHMILEQSKFGQDFSKLGWLEVKGKEAQTSNREQYKNWIMMAICNIVACINPDLFLLSGNMIEEAGFDVELAIDLVRRTNLVGCEIRCGDLGSDAVLIGAAQAVFQAHQLVRP
jgi:glucokinase